LDLDIRFPKELGGSGGATNPEQLFAAAWSACFGISVTIAAVKQNIKIAEENSRSFGNSKDWCFTR